MRRTLDSVARQTVPPALWVVVDDGSTDETPAILKEYAARLPYLRVVRREDRGCRSVGPGVIEAFYAGLDTVAVGDFSYLCKLDLDLDLPPRYFELIMQRMEAEPRKSQERRLGVRAVRG
jgi:glycosyltransferase involved in cell wall biosynthesis